MFLEFFSSGIFFTRTIEQIIMALFGEYYSTFLRDNQAFWDLKDNLKKDISIFSNDFKELVNGMLQKDTSKRLTLEDIKKSKWYKGPVLNAKSLKEEMKDRWTIFEAKKKM